MTSTTTTTPQLYPTKNDLPGQRAERLYPTLTPAQLARITVHGRARHVERGEVLVQAGEQTARLFVVVAGRPPGLPPAGPPGGPFFFNPRGVSGGATTPSGRPGPPPHPGAGGGRGNPGAPAHPPPPLPNPRGQRPP